MLVKQTSHQLILRDKPSSLWLFGGFFVFIGAVFVYGSLGGFENRNEVPGWVIVVSFFMGAIAVAVGTWQIYIHPLSQIFLDSQTRTVTIKQIGLFRKREIIYSFDELDKFYIMPHKDSEGDFIWRIEMRLIGGEAIQVTHIWERDENECIRISEIATDFVKFNR